MEALKRSIVQASKSGNVLELQSSIDKLPSGYKLMDITDAETCRNALLIASHEGHIDVITKLIEDKLCEDINSHKDSQGTVYEYFIA